MTGSKVNKRRLVIPNRSIGDLPTHYCQKEEAGRAKAIGAVSTQFGNIVVMALYPEPHSAEWFTALGVFDPRQAATTRQILKAVGRKDVCSVCGDHPAEPLRIVAANLPAEAVASIRLCADCRKMRWQMYGEVFEPL
jgi:hypothetical protein